MRRSITLSFLLAISSLFTFGQTYTFTNCGATGNTGPTQLHCDLAYGPGVVTINTQGIQEWVVPATGTYSIRAIGATGGNQNEPTVTVGHPADIYGEFNFTAGDIIKIAVGQTGYLGSTRPGWGGGGGSFVTRSDNSPLIIAGGCGSGHTSLTNDGLNEQNASITQSGKNGSWGAGSWPAGNGAIGGSGGDGAGFFTNGTIGNGALFMNTVPSHTVPQSFLNGLVGGAMGGGFGGGGGVTNTYGGGGGGYSGGQGAVSYPYYGGGGGSFNSGINQSNALATNNEFVMAHGQVLITSLAPLCTGPSFLTCPSNITVNNVPTNCGRVVNYTLPTFDAGDCGGTVMTQIDGTGLTKGDLFPVGATTQTYVVEDINGNTDTCSFIVTVVDNEPPVITSCPSDITVFTTPGMCSAVVAWAQPTASDNCPGVFMAPVPQGPGTAFPLDTTVITYTAVDASGNTTTCTFNVIVIDNEAPVITNCTPDILVSNDAGDCGAIVTFAAPTYTENCTMGTEVASQASGTFFPVGTTTVTWTLTDDSGNSTTCDFDVVVEDTEAPAAVCSDITVQLDTLGVYTMLPAEIGGGSTDNCGIASLSASQTVFSCADIGDNTITLTVEDIHGNLSTCDATVTVADTVSPIAICQNITVQLNATGNASILATEVDNGSDDACGIASLTVSPSTFTCANIGANTVTLTVTDDNGNVSTCDATVTVADTIDPIAVCQNITVQLDASGNASIVAADVDNGSDDACGIASLAVSPNTFTCANVGANTVTLTVTDNNGNVSTCDATVTIADTIDPIAVCQNVTIYTDAAGIATLAPIQIDGGSSDACGIASISASKTSFDCSFLGDNTVTLTVTDNNGNVSTCDAIVTVEDTIAPIALCQNATTYLDALGSASAGPGLIDNGSSDNCGIDYIYTFNNTFNCSDVGTYTITLVVGDASGNESTCTSTLTIEDTIAPNALCQNHTVQLDGTGNATISVSDVNAGSNDACGIASMTIAPDAFTCANVGPNTVTLTVTDVNGNVSTCTSIVTVEESTPPVAVCQNITVQLDASGNAMITGMDIDGGSTDNCGIVTWTATPNTFTCAEVGPQTVTLTVTDGSGNSDVCTATVTVEDTIAPTMICQNQTIYLNALGLASITANAVDGGSDDACGIASLTADITSFNCSNVGTNNVELTAIDVNGNSASCTAVVTVLDTISPIAICQNITVQLDASGNATIAGTDVNNGSNDACGIASLAVSPSAFTCANVGANTVTLTVTDNNGNTSTCTATVTVEDTVAPNAICQNLTVQLDASGNTSITAAQIDNGSNDACGIASLSVSPSTFTCANVGANTVTLTVVDNNGNTSTCTSTVSVEDNVDPIAACQSITVQLDASGNAMITGAQVNNGSSDACGIASLAVSPNTFTCANVGPNTVTLTVTDNNGNTSTCTSTVTVEDNVAPNAVCQDITVSLDASGNATITAAQIDGGSNDACGIASISASQTTFDCSDLPVIDPAQSLIITGIVDGPLTGGVPKAIELYAKDNIADLSLYGIGSANNGGGTDGQEFTLSGSATAGQYLYVASEAVGFNNYFGFAPNFTTGAASINGDDAIELFYNGGVVDVFGNINQSGTGQPWDYLDGWAYRNDLTGPDGTTFVLGSWSFSGINALDGTTSNATAANPMPIGTFVAQPAGIVPVTLTVTDNNGNVSTCVANVTVEDNIAPTAVCQSYTVALDASGNAAITAANIDGGSFDNCGIETMTASPNTFTCANLGVNAVTLTVTDQMGNVSTCTANVTVVDNIAPTAICANITVQLNGAGVATITASDVNGGSFDNCTIASTSIDISTFDCSDIGPNNVVLTVVDQSGNSSNCTAIVTVEDNVDPVANCQNLTIQLNAAGIATITPSMINNGSSDACGIATLSASQTTFDCSDVGANSVTLTVIDVNGNSSTCTATVTVQDVTAPVIVCAPAVTVNTNPGVCGATVSLTAPATTEACGIASVTNNAPALFPVGSTTVTWTVTDVNGNSSTCEQVVTVEDNENPTISCPANITVSTDPGSCDAAVVLNSPIVSDNCGTVITNNAPAAFALGTTAVTWTVTDPSGNTASCVQLVTVEDNEAPSIVCPAPITVETDPGVCVASGVVLNSPVTDDNCTVATITNDAPTFYQLGANNVTWTVTDNAGNSTTCVQIVTVVDNELPSVQCPADIVENIVTGSCGRTIFYPTPNALDNCMPVIMTQIDGTGYTSGSVFPIGTTVQTYEGLDASGNVFTCSFTVTIVDNEFPTLSNCPGSQVAYSTPDVCEVPVFWPTPVVSDNCFGATLSSNYAAGDNFPVGTSTVIYTAGDQAGNLVSCSFTVTVIDTIAPVGPTSMPDVVSSCEVTLDPPTATDNCGGTITATTSTSFPITTIGITGVVWTFNDGNGNTSSVVQYVDIDGEVNTTVSILNDITLQANNTGSNVSYQWISCPLGQEIAGATEQTYQATINGSYAVVVTEGDCPPDTSFCYTINSVGLEDVAFEDMVVYPNPSNDGKFNIRYTGRIEAIEVIDMLGRFIAVPTDNENTYVDASALATGKYMLRVYTEHEVTTKEVIISNK